MLDEMNSKKNDYAVRVATRTGRMTQEPLYPEGHPKRIEQDSQRNNIDAPRSSKRKKRKMIGLCKLLVNLLLKHLIIQMISLCSMLKHNLVMNMDLVKMLMMMSMMMPNLVMIMIWKLNLLLILITHNQRINIMIREILLLGNMVKKENHGFKNPCLFLPNHPRKRMMRILSTLLK